MASQKLKKWLLFCAVIIAINTATNVASFIWFSNGEKRSYVTISYLEHCHKNFDFSEKDGQIHGGLAISNNLLSGDAQKDRETARSLLQGKHWEYVTTEEKMLEGHKVFVFKFIPSKNPANEADGIAKNRAD